MEQESTSKRITDLIAKKLETIGSGRAVAKKIKLSNTTIENYKAGASMKLDNLARILEAFPELREPVAEILLGEPIKKHTAATNNEEAAVKKEREELYKDLETFRTLASQQSVVILRLSGGVPEAVKEG